MQNVATKLRGARAQAPSVPEVILDFTDYVADVIATDWNYDLIPESLAVLLCEVRDYLQNKEGLLKSVPSVKLPDNLEAQKEEITTNLGFFPRIIDKIASQEFAEKFRELFYVVCPAKPPEEG